mgnify:CR=1 FL=1
MHLIIRTIRISGGAIAGPEPRLTQSVLGRLRRFWLDVHLWLGVGLFLLAITVVTQVVQGAFTWLMQEQLRKAAEGAGITGSSDSGPDLTPVPAADIFGRNLDSGGRLSLMPPLGALGLT